MRRRNGFAAGLAARGLARLAVAGLALTLCAPAVAAPPAVPPLTPLQALHLSAALFREGLARQDPVLLLAAARLRPSAQPAPGAAKDAPLPDAAAMLDAAAALAEDDAALQGLIRDARSEGTRGMASGPFYSIASLDPGETDALPAADFAGGTYAEAYVEATGADTDLNLEVRDGAGNLVCADRDPGPIAYCGWRPETTGPFVLTVQNLGPVATRYALMTN